jgi:D-alanyl-D-alanine carboxypeptidase
MENPIFQKTVSAKTVKVGNRVLKNHNKLLWQIDGAEGVKTGFTKAAGRILVSSVRRNDRRVIAVTINAPSDWADHKKLQEDSFSRYTICPIVTKGEKLGTVEVAGGENRRVEVLAAEDFCYALAPEETAQTAIPGPGFVYAPAVSGADAGCAYILVSGKAVGSVRTVFGQTVEQKRSEEKTLWQKLFG